MTQSPRLFISYSHDSPEHKERVVDLSERLRSDGLDATIDQYIENKGPAEGWPRWMEEQLRISDFVLLICTAVYRRRLDGREDSGKGHGVAWEGNLVYQAIYNAATRNEKFVPVLLEGAGLDDIPLPLQGVPSYSPVDEAGYEALYRRLTGQPRVERRQLGSMRALPSRNIAVGGLPKTTGEAPVPRRWKSAAVLTTMLLATGLAATLFRTLRAPAVYNVRVSVLDVAGRPAENAKVRSSLGGELVRSDSGWQIVIPATSKPADSKLIVRASSPAAFQEGETEVLLRKESFVSATIRMRTMASARVHGTVMDASQHVLEGVQVRIMGFNERVVTTADGGFSLYAHAADGQQVQLHAEKEGYVATTTWQPAGDPPAVLILQAAR